MKNRVGEKHITNEGCEIEIIEYISAANITIRFKSGIILNNRTYQNIKKGQIKNPNIKNICEVGYFGVGRYGTKQHRKLYVVWTNMIRRCYDEEVREKCPTYKDVTVCEEWHNFQNFAEWCYSQKFFNVTDFNGEPYELDKDILVRGNKTYSPETCCFVPKAINNLFKFSNRQNKKNPLGVYFKKSLNKYGASYKDSEGKHRHIGYFNNQIDAFSAYKVVKESTIKDVAVKYKDFIDQRTYEAMVGWEVTLKD